MKISPSLYKFHLHDSTVDAIYHIPSEKHLILPIRLCDWDGDSEPDEIFGKSGLLVFYGVENFKTEPELKGLAWDREWGFDVLSLDYHAGFDLEDRQGIQGSFYFQTVPRNISGSFLFITFIATHFEWFETQ